MTAERWRRLMVLALRSWRISWFERTISIRVNRALAIFRFPLVLRNVGAKRFVAIVESTHAPKILKVRNREDILPSNLYTHSILSLEYQTYEEIEHMHCSILTLTTEKIVAQLIQQGLAPQTARRCVDLFDEVEWHKAQLPLRRWLESIRDFYHRSRLVQEPLHPALRSAARAAA